ncbi:TPA: hypothetical protein CPT95_06935 [Candidatus Gastranaerophilales bacterium HUM_15]|nr:MAG TPA: hypothetical protein CPT99_10640 [Candidatus Gastranaerophilales bacterium HUM_4]DAA90848.1 MAG TPA: hypothetical protein CPT87_06430 [Candidatus Gastranaerophilales bacterium HUM_5]DAB03418.1 MAG TPA: hypothetical protein CPT96_01395 [Candidatus Gastranaerophilales bacterium HUM_10]DAB08134.1 MAG TPA: hypothetical protein CPT95_06935 [Candidatus Gastranaerophilales bacterium HUM_15]DAB11814.1 MAG TPA: hypothetical protein CPT91_04535 [Candidatus Gastranaerophilales bacterium HUM_16
MLLYIILIFQDKPYNYYMDVKKELGLKIKRLRQKEGLTQEQFAEKLNIATRTLAGIEIGESFVSAQTIENILNYTNISFEDFFISSHLRPTEDLLNDIYIYLEKIKNDRDKVENIYKVIKALSNE